MDLKPSEVLSNLKHEIVGQDEGCRAIVRALLLSLSVANARIDGGVAGSPPIIATLVIGSTASGKTFIVRKAVHALGIQAVYIDCSALTGAGWSGRSLSDALHPVAQLQQENPDQPVAVVFDEFDKIVRGTGDGANRGFEIGPELLALFNGGTITLETERHNGFDLDTDRLVIVFLGAFTGIEDYVKDRRCSARREVALGFASPSAAKDDGGATYFDVKPEDLEAWGIMRELVGRIWPAIALPPLPLQDLVAIARDCAASSYARALPGGASLTVSESAALEIGREAMESGLGARAVNNRVRELAAQANADMLEDDTIVSATIACSDGKLQLEYVHGTRQTAAPAIDSGLAARQKRLNALVSSLMAPDSRGDDGNSSENASDMPGLMDCLVPPERFVALANLKHVDALCDALLRYGLSDEDAHRLLKALVLYVGEWYRAQPDCRRMGEVLKLVALARRGDPECALSPLDVMIEGCHKGDEAFYGFADWLAEPSRTRDEVSTGAVCLSEYRRFARLDAMGQNAVALNVARSAARAILEEENRGGLLAGVDKGC
ncbi:MAG: AAA family ATPase [Eggerthellaceae bacterium]|nr:AAA family ATPase [Eggerthellaceae bacterium]